MQPIALVRSARQQARQLPTSTGGWLGVIGASDPSDELASTGRTVSWYDKHVAISGPVCATSAETEIVCGEVVLDNTVELRQSLEMPNAAALELIAELFRLHGPAAILHARGMYAVAIWQPAKQRLTLLRDGTGARNVYYSVDGRRGWFSSTLRGLRRSPAMTGSLSLTALRNYLSCAYVPGAETMWQNAFEVRPGTALTLPDCRAETVWRPTEAEWDRGEPLESAAAGLRPLLEDAVHCCMPHDEPVGVFLSGGLDSSLVTALAAKHASGLVYTYAIHFGAEYRNELEFSGMVAAHCRTKHRIIELPGGQIRDNIAASIAALDDPIGDPLTTPNLILGRAAAENVGTILNGEGGDPCFGGPKNLPMMLHELYSSSGREEAYLRAYQKCYDDLPMLLTAEVQAQLKQLPPQEAMFAPYLEPDCGMQRYLNRLMLMNTLFKGADHILTKVNNLTSANNLLGRSPLFDRRIVEASFAVPPEHKQSGAIEKAILKRAVADLLPEPIINRPKSGMLVPVQAWFRRDLRRMARGMLLSRRARIRPYIRQDILRNWLAYRGSLWPRYGVKLWLVLTLEIWLRENE